MEEKILNVETIDWNFGRAIIRTTENKTFNKKVDVIHLHRPDVDCIDITKGGAFIKFLSEKPAGCSLEKWGEDFVLNCFVNIILGGKYYLL